MKRISVFLLFSLGPSICHAHNDVQTSKEHILDYFESLDLLAQKGVMHEMIELLGNKNNSPEKRPSQEDRSHEEDDNESSQQKEKHEEKSKETTNQKDKKPTDILELGENFWGQIKKYTGKGARLAQKGFEQSKKWYQSPEFQKFKNTLLEKSGEYSFKTLKLLRSGLETIKDQSQDIYHSKEVQEIKSKISQEINNIGKNISDESKDLWKKAKQKILNKESAEKENVQENPTKLITNNDESPPSDTPETQDLEDGQNHKTSDR